jgi:hypothetical protein
MHRIAVLFFAMFAVSTAAIATDARAETAQPTSRQLPTIIKQSRVESSVAKTFIINGHRVSVPANEHAEAVIKALKERYPGLKPDTGSQGMTTAVN